MPECQNVIISECNIIRMSECNNVRMKLRSRDMVQPMSMHVPIEYSDILRLKVNTLIRVRNEGRNVRSSF